jgi:polyvinyl alcohol dehydrogenase (cytochrome)
MAWVVNTTGDVSATPAVEGKSIYFPDFGGMLYKVDSKTGEIVWQRQISDYVGSDNNFSRTTPAIHGKLLIFGDQGGREGDNGGAHLIAVNKNTGALEWVTTLDSHFAAIVTQSATISDHTVYVGVSSFEEALSAFIPGYPCCSFKGSMAAVDAHTGEILWQTPMAPDGFSGNAIWGSSPAVDKKRGQVYIATGNNYSAPQPVLDCVTDAGDDADAQRACLLDFPDNYFDAVVALDMKTGEVNWANIVLPYDVWTVACLFGAPTCPNPSGPDFDFGQAPMLYAINTKGKKGKGKGKKKGHGKKQEFVGVGQKSGTFWSLDPDTGETVWSTAVSPGGIAGGMMWGSAFDGKLIYTSSANSDEQSWDLVGGGSTTGGIWSGLDPATGEIIWQTANPVGDYNAGGAVTSANGVIFVCSQDPMGYMYALESTTGNVLWSFASGGSCNSGAAVAKGKVYWGSGYAGFGPPNTSNPQFYAFELPKKSKKGKK